IPLRQGRGSGTLLLPPNLPTGCYRLIGYTRYQRNESEEFFFEKIIGVVNPMRPEIFAEESDRRELFAPPASGRQHPETASGIRIGTDRTLYGFRNRVELSLEEIPEDIHTLSVSVTGTDAAAPESGLAR
ncbi:MAG: hypothetical protein LUD68_03065, partial [Rikenellaceae bacterium]|nr:hypothetical protein [Rikenellaceae bacterium]